MSATRLLILGALRFLQPAHGYSIRQELESWGAADWANIAYGSIYFALNKLAQEGLVAVTDTEQEGKRPARTIYVVTEAGEGEFQRLLREFWREYYPVRDPFAVAWGFMGELPRDELLAAMRKRIADAQLAAIQLQQLANRREQAEKPSYVYEIVELRVAQIDLMVAWGEKMIGKIERGELP